MTESRGRSPSRCLLVWATATVATGLLQAWLLPAVVAAAPGLATDPFEELVLVGCELAVALVTGWLWLLTSVVVLDALRGRGHHGGAGVPAVVRRLVLAACGLSLATGLALPAQADSGQQRPSSMSSLLAGLPVPDRMTATQWVGALARGRTSSPAAAAASAPATATAVEVVVRSGDTLWDLAAADLPPGAPAADIALRWREIYAANRSVVGADPDLILPGQRLVLPRRDAQGPR